MGCSMNLISFTDTFNKLGVSRRTLYRIVENDKSFPRAKKPFGQKVYFVKEDIDSWLENAMSENAKSS